MDIQYMYAKSFSKLGGAIKDDHSKLAYVY